MKSMMKTHVGDESDTESSASSNSLMSPTSRDRRRNSLDKMMASCIEQQEIQVERQEKQVQVLVAAIQSGKPTKEQIDEKNRLKQMELELRERSIKLQEEQQRGLMQALVEMSKNMKK